MNTSIPDGLMDSVDYVQEPNSPPATTRNSFNEENPLASEDASETSSRQPSNRLSGSMTEARDLALKKARISGDGRGSGRARRSHITSSSLHREEKPSNNRLSRQGSVSREQQQPQLPPHRHSDDDTVNSDSLGAVRVRGLSANGGASVDNLFVSTNNLQPEAPNAVQGQEQTTANVTVEAQLARDPEEVIDEARREWERGIVTAEVVAVREGESLPPPQQQQLQLLPSSQHSVEKQEEPEQSGGSSKRITKLAIGVILVVVIIIIAVVVAIVLPIGGKGESETFEERRNEFLEVVSLVSDTSAALDEKNTTPQSRALDWLVRGDRAGIDPRVLSTQEIVQRYVLTVLYFATAGDDSFTPPPGEGNTWPNSDSVVCRWDGVTCEEYSQVVISLDLSNQSLRGQLPTELGSLTTLSSLQLSRNQLTGTIPSNLGSLRKLKYLAMDRNKLSGTIPRELGSTQLEYLDLGFNDLTGVYPPQLLRLTNMASLWLCCNDIMTATVEPALCALDSSGIPFEWDRLGLDCVHAGLDCSCCTHCCESRCDCETQLCDFSPAAPVQSSFPTSGPIQSITTAGPTTISLASPDTLTPTLSPVDTPVMPPINDPTNQPARKVTNPPSRSPTPIPSPSPTKRPNPTPTKKPTPSPTRKPTSQPVAPQTSVDFESKLTGRASGDKFGSYVEFSRDGTTVAVGAPGSNSYVRVFRKSGASWVRIGQTMTGSGQFGHRVELNRNGNILVVGAPTDDTGGQDNGLVRVYEYNGSDSWDRKGSNLVGENNVDRFGWDVAISDDGLTVAGSARTGDPGGLSDAGYVKVFTFNGGSWNQLGPTLEGQDESGQFGRSVDLSADGRSVAVGAVSAFGKGRIYVYDYQSGSNSWELKGQVLDGINNDDWQGTSVALSAEGDILAIGADGHDENGSNSGMVRVYEFVGCCSWEQYGNTIFGESALDQLGAGQVSLSSDGELLGVGANHHNSDRGKAYLYRYINGDWRLVDSMEGHSTGDKFGFSVSVAGDGTQFAVGGPTENPGYAKIYQVKLS